MDKNQVWQLYNNLEPGQKIEISFGGDVKISWDVQGSKTNYIKKKKIYIGKIEPFPELPRNFRMKTKSFVSPRQKGKQSFYKFGTLLPKRMRKSPDNDKIIQLANMFLLLKELGLEVKEGFWVDTFMKLEYETKTIDSVTVYYYQGTPRYIQFKDEEKIGIPQFRDTLNTEYFTNEQLGLEDK